MRKYLITCNGRQLQQGDILRSILHLQYIEDLEGDMVIHRIEYPRVVVLSQACDLQQDWNSRNRSNDDKELFSILVSPLYNWEHFLDGEHLDHLGMSMVDYRSGSSTAKRIIMHNKNPRYHYLDKFPTHSGLPALIVDFKHFFSVDIGVARGARPSHFICRLNKLYREHLSQRFSAFLSRIGLPS